MNEQSFVDLMYMTFVLRCRTKGDKDFVVHVTDNIEKNGLPFLNCLEIKDSTIHGKGVFANRDIPLGMVVGIYPCHGIIEDNKYFSFGEYISYVEKYKETKTETELEKYKICVDMNNNIFIFGIPEIQNDYLVGHLINDSCSFVNDLFNITDVKTFSKPFERYLINSLSKNNCVFVKYLGLVYIKTIKLIKSGEELVTSYDIGYWCKSLKTTQLNIITIEYLSTLCEEKKQYILKILKKIMEEMEHLEPSYHIIKKLFCKK